MDDLRLRSVAKSNVERSNRIEQNNRQNTIGLIGRGFGILGLLINAYLARQRKLKTNNKNQITHSNPQNMSIVSIIYNNTLLGVRYEKLSEVFGYDMRYRHSIQYGDGIDWM